MYSKTKTFGVHVYIWYHPHFIVLINQIRCGLYLYEYITQCQVPDDTRCNYSLDTQINLTYSLPVKNKNLLSVPTQF